jgi:hypothetical protein
LIGEEAQLIGKLGSDPSDATYDCMDHAPDAATHRIDKDCQHPECEANAPDKITDDPQPMLS